MIFCGLFFAALDKPSVKINDVFVMADESAHMICQTKAYPEAKITWTFEPCRDLKLWPSCGNDLVELELMSNSSLLRQISVQKIENKVASEIIQASEIKFMAIQPGKIKCKAKNQLGSDNATGFVFISDLVRPFLISGLEDQRKISAGDKVKLECVANIYNYTRKLLWRKNGDVVTNSKEIIVKEINLKHSWGKTILWTAISKEDSGIYECEATQNNNFKLSEKLQVNITVHDTQIPKIISNFNVSIITLNIGDSLNLECLALGLPVPYLVWYKDQEMFTINEKNLNRVKLNKTNSTINFDFLLAEDAGMYKCETGNRVGSDYKIVTVKVLRE